MAQDLFDPVFRVNNLVLQFPFRKVRKIGVRHGMATDFKSLGIESAKLLDGQVAGRAQQSRRRVKSGVEAEFAEHGSRGNQVGLTTIVESEADAGFGGVMEGLAHAQALPPESFSHSI